MKIIAVVMGVLALAIAGGFLKVYADSAKTQEFYAQTGDFCVSTAHGVTCRW